MPSTPRIRRETTYRPSPPSLSRHTTASTVTSTETVLATTDESLKDARRALKSLQTNAVENSPKLSAKLSFPTNPVNDSSILPGHSREVSPESSLAQPEADKSGVETSGDNLSGDFEIRPPAGVIHEPPASVQQPLLDGAHIQELGPISTLRDASRLSRRSWSPSASSTGSSDQEQERRRLRNRRPAPSHLQRPFRHVDTEILSPSPPSSADHHWLYDNEDEDPDLSIRQHLHDANFGSLYDSEDSPVRTAGLTKPVTPTFILRQATLQQVAPDDHIAQSSSAVQSQTRDYLGIPDAATFARARARGEVSIDEVRKRDDMMPLDIDVNIHLRFHGPDGVIQTQLKPLRNFAWTLTRSYQELVSKQDIAVPENHEIYLRNACFYVVGEPRVIDDLFYSSIDDEDENTLSDYAKRDICLFIGTHHTRYFSLEIHWDYSSVLLNATLHSESGMQTSLADTIQHEIQRKVLKNFEDQRYIPNADLNQFLVLDVVQRIINEDATLRQSASEIQRLDFARKVQLLPAVKLLAICVYTGLDMQFLRHLVESHGFSDKVLPMTDQSCKWFPCPGKITRIREAMPAFFTRTIDEDRSFHELDDEEVMPVFHGGADKSMKTLGRGGNGTVYDVGVEPAHTDLSGDPDTRFALKEFAEEPGTSSRRKAFDREYEMLKVLVEYQEDHIVQPLTFWSRKSKAYILYPKASASLQGFFETRKPPDLSSGNLSWLLGQLQGIANAIEHVHDLWLPPGGRRKRTPELLQGFHGDIKPDNILVFETSRPVFKIADFGAGQFNRARQDGKSRNINDTLGDPTYYAPDFKKEKRVSRPADMWALGCVFLELLLWYFEFFTGENEEHFSAQRAEYPGAPSNFTTNYYWYKEQSPAKPGWVYGLRPAVVKAIQDLKKICHRMRAFERLIEVIRRLLRIEPNMRWKASRLARSLKNITKQAARDLREQPDYYIRLYHENRGGTEQHIQLPKETVNPLISTAGSTRSDSPAGHHRAESADSTGLSRIASSPTRTGDVLISMGGADALSHSPDTPIETLTTVESRPTPPSRALFLQPPRPRSYT